MYLNVIESIFKATVWDMLSLLIGIKMNERLRFSEAQPGIPNDWQKAQNFSYFFENINLG